MKVVLLSLENTKTMLQLKITGNMPNFQVKIFPKDPL